MKVLNMTSVEQHLLLFLTLLVSFQTLEECVQLEHWPFQGRGTWRGAWSADQRTRARAGRARPSCRCVRSAVVATLQVLACAHACAPRGAQSCASSLLAAQEMQMTQQQQPH